MALGGGTRLGPYEIVAPLGAELMSKVSPITLSNGVGIDYN